MTASRYFLECIHLSRKLPGRKLPDRKRGACDNGDCGGRLLLDDINFALGRSEVLAVVGPNGAGKSTLLRLLNRLDEPTGGQILCQGKDYRELAPRQHRRRVGMVMQQAFLFPGTVAENIAFGPAQVGVDLTPAAIEELLFQVGLEGYAARNVANLSGGEAQRVAILRALANNPELLLLDEPTSALDEAAKFAVESVLASLIEERKLTCIWVTHDSGQTKRVAGKLLRLEGGRVHAFHAIEEGWND
jgi:putative ABC transport system ATP-binding protein